LAQAILPREVYFKIPLAGGSPILFAMSLVQMVTVDRVGRETVPVEVQDPLSAQSLLAAAAKKFRIVNKQSRVYHGVTGLELRGELQWSELQEAFVVLSGKAGWRGAERLQSRFASSSTEQEVSAELAEPAVTADSYDEAVTAAMLLSAAGSRRADGVVLCWKETQANGYLSNWARSPIVIDHIQYSSVEQWIMASKARVCHDDEVIRQIMNSSSPRKQKGLGRSLDSSMVKRYWTLQKKWDTQLLGVRAKFQQNDRLALKLLATGFKQIAEASPSDRIFGIGMAPSDPLAQNPANWKGTNLLGRALVVVREEMRLQILSTHADQECGERAREQLEVATRLRDTVLLSFSTAQRETDVLEGVSSSEPESD